MSIPASLKAGPFTTQLLVKKRYLLFHIFLIWISIFLIQFEFWWYWNLLFYNNYILFITFLPGLLILMYFSSIFISLIFAKILLILINSFHPIKEGVFIRDPPSKDYRYWCIRSVIKKWPIWLAHKFPFPFLDNICFKLFGVKTKFSNSLFEGWVDTELIEFGENVIIGQGAIIQSAMIVGNLLILKKTVIGDDVHIGAHSFVMPGTRIGDKTILAASSATTVGQELEGNMIYLGVPAKIYKENKFFQDNLENVIINTVKDEEALREKYEELYIKRHDQHLSILERYHQYQDKKEEELERILKAQVKRKKE